MIVDALRATLHRALSTTRGDGLAPVRATKGLARELNHLLGDPLCPGDELARRRAAEARLDGLRGRAPVAPTRREPSPVTVYFEKDRNQRLIEQVEQTLAARGIAYKMLDVTGDPNTKSFVMREAKCEEDDLPIVFVAAEAIGGFPALVAADLSGALMKAVLAA